MGLYTGVYSSPLEVSATNFLSFDILQGRLLTTILYDIYKKITFLTAQIQRLSV